jgi:diaminohydroxyphosphoribosylaminopyrimidine deaminase/5-amino-6-(5-phosphoribosylamino)uracil reductase
MPRETDEKWMRLALELALHGQGLVEPNPMVGCVLVRDGQEVGRGYHRRFGDAHAEVNALRVAGDARGATAYVTLEPCCHQGKTGACSVALVQAGVSRVVVAALDPFPQIAGGGVRQLRAAGISVDVGVLEDAARDLNASFFCRWERGRPWVIAKWAMSLDGKIATAAGDSRWISNENSRAWVHRLRGRMDGIIVGFRTALRDDPQLTARPAGPRLATRIVFDSRLELPLDSRLIASAFAAPVMLIADRPKDEARRRVEGLGCQVFDVAGAEGAAAIELVLRELARREMCNVLVEGGGRMLGSFFDADCIDEVIAFIAPRLIGGSAAPSPIGGAGSAELHAGRGLRNLETERFGDDFCLRGRIQRSIPYE